MKIGYQGVEGAYSEAALVSHFGTEVQPVGFKTFEEVFEAITSKKVDAGVLPFENSITGSIVQNYDLLLKEGLTIQAEIFHSVNHHLLASKGTSLENVKQVYSHPQALEQCREFIRKHDLEEVPAYDTAGAAKLIAESKKEDQAAIASRFCAKIYGLDIISEYIGHEKNITKFFVIVSTEVKPSWSKEKTSVAFRTKHYPGALINCLQRFSKNNINLTKLESRPMPENPFEYVFYVDFEGGVDDENVKLSLTEIEAASEFLKVLGSYPKGKKE